MRNHRSMLLAAALAAIPASGAAQELTLAAALEIAEGGAYANRIADGQATEQGAQQLAALRGILPSVRAEGGYLRTDEPLSAFGLALQQRNVTQADFDPARLNDPPAITNYTGSLVLEQPLLNADAHAGRVAARHAARASRAAAGWTRVSTRVDVIRAYYGAVLAREQVVTLESGVEAARAHVSAAEAMVRNGLATKSDALLAAVKAGEVEAQLAEARGQSALAVRQLMVLLGTPEVGAVAPARLPGAERIRSLESIDWNGEVERRADVTAARAGLSAARSDVTRARTLYLPRLNGFARYDWNSPDALYSGEEAWTVGVMLSWSPFSGGAQLAESQAARGRESAARAGAEAAVAQARLEVEKAETDWSVALERLRIAEEGVQQSVEAHRIVSRKYEGGLATVLELLSAAATETEAALRLSNARYQAITAAAERLQALGLDPAMLTTLDHPGREG